MSTEISPLNRQRSKKIDGGRVSCIVYLPKEEVRQIDETAKSTGLSRSSVIARIYYQGKEESNMKKE
ncbi:ribbon-helix-helix protein, CopG family [Acinetobacter qingfengensis]|uniref:Uncharacterized protein n=1 Tax=Acinetobacter qingfengensis TaxID=1262585 RepID=A0A1E7RC20_9GAMM|nr:ribbon-helix-helix protein, CopG family [Acinetobacter qingfengensis]KAA8734890.1 ribbon-helix-helix protein, CopG family [Acinetobacter qingfengensis]OEY96940.1 hypothetical protein BJI46_11705 [Acinetobacter qingfengensis]